MRFAYADPPYLGVAAKHYASLHPDAALYDLPEAHATLIARLGDEFDAWALSLSVPSLRTILPMCPGDVRVGCWVKPFASFKPGVNPGYCWEPVIFKGGRKLGRDVPTIRDYCSAPIALRKGIPGAKPFAFCWWVFDFLGVTAEDDFTDIFPGSGSVTEAWMKYILANRKTPLFQGDVRDFRRRRGSIMTVTTEAELRELARRIASALAEGRKTGDWDAPIDVLEWARRTVRGEAERARLRAMVKEEACG